MTLCCAHPALAAGEDTGFLDVKPGDWFASYVAVCVEEGLMEGTGGGLFQPEKGLTTEEAMVLTARLYWRLEEEAGPLPKGGTKEEFYRLVGYDEATIESADMAWQFQDLLALDWAWDGVFYLTQQFRETFGSNSTHFYSIGSGADRECFAELLALPAARLDLEGINTIGPLPDVDREYYPQVYRLYEAGILTGMDRYGSFGAKCSLTRAEAAAVAARFLRPELRVSFTPDPLPTGGYTLTYLMDGTSWLTYPIALVDYTDENGEYANCFLTLEGERLPWPEGTEEGVPSFGLHQDGEYILLRPWDRSGGDYWGTKAGLMDRNGDMAIPFGRFDDVRSTDDGRFIGKLTDDSPAMAKTRVFLLSADGAVEAELSSYYGTPTNDWRGFNQGVCPWQDEESQLWGYVDQTGTWVVPPIWGSAEPFRQGFAVVTRMNEEERWVWGLIDLRGELVLPLAYDELYVARNSPGYEGETLIWYRDPEGSSGWLTSTGVPLPAGVLDREEGGFQNGYSAYHGVYYDLSMKPVSQKFDWTGTIGPDGRGFVGLDEKIYRIQFE